MISAAVFLWSSSASNRDGSLRTTFAVACAKREWSLFGARTAVAARIQVTRSMRPGSHREEVGKKVARVGPPARKEVACQRAHQPQRADAKRTKFFVKHALYD